MQQPLQPQPTRRRGRGCLWALLAVALVVVLFIVVIAVAATNTTNANKQALRDTTVTSCGPPDAIGATYGEGTVRNSSSGRSDFSISLAVVSPSNVQLGTGTTFVSDVEAGQTATWKALTDVSSDKWVSGSTCKLTTVTRHASTNP
jgi:hypothetical protein